MADKNDLKEETGVVEQIEVRQGLHQAPSWLQELQPEELKLREKKLIRKIDSRLSVHFFPTLLN